MKQAVAMPLDPNANGEDGNDGNDVRVPDEDEGAEGVYTGLPRRAFKHVPVPNFPGLLEDWDDWSYRFDSVVTGLDDRLDTMLRETEEVKWLS